MFSNKKKDANLIYTAYSTNLIFAKIKQWGLMSLEKFKKSNHRRLILLCFMMALMYCNIPSNLNILRNKNDKTVLLEKLREITR